MTVAISPGAGLLSIVHCQNTTDPFDLPPFHYGSLFDCQQAANPLLDADKETLLDFYQSWEYNHSVEYLIGGSEACQIQRPMH